MNDLLARDRAHLIHPQHDRAACDSAHVWVKGEGALLTDASGVVQATLAGSTTDASGNWILQGPLPKTVPANSPVYVKVKATKRTVGKFVCKAGFSAVIQLR